MAAQTRLIRLTWENNVSFKAETKLDDGDWILLLEMDENNHLAGVWDNEITGVVTKFLNLKMAEIGNDMKA